MNQFSYLSEKILDAQFLNDPCRHLEFNNFLGEEQLDIILNDEQIHFINYYFGFLFLCAR